MFIPFSQLLIQGRDDNHIVAIGNGGTHRFKELRDDVCFNASRIKTLGVSEIVLVAGDSYRFAVGLLAILHAGCRVILPTNGQPRTLRQHLDNWDTLLTDIPLEGSDHTLEILSGSAEFDLEPLPSQ